jgi:hypothetical protein
MGSLSPSDPPLVQTKPPVLRAIEIAVRVWRTAVCGLTRIKGQGVLPADGMWLPLI